MPENSSQMRARGASALRKGRCSLPFNVYHVTTVTAERRKIFLNLAAGRILVTTLRGEWIRHQVSTLAYVVMPDHLHWLMQLPANRTLAETLRSVKSISSRLIARRLRVRTPIWQPSYHDHAIRRNESLIEIARYIVANPLRAKIVMAIGQYSLWDAIWVDEKFEL